MLHHADVSVCCDSGLMHLALAAGTRTVALFGPTEPAILVQNDPNLVAIETAQDCQGCWNRDNLAEHVGKQDVAMIRRWIDQGAKNN